MPPKPAIKELWLRYQTKSNDWRWLTPEEYIRDSDSANFAHLSIDGNKVDQDESLVRC